MLNRALNNAFYMTFYMTFYLFIILHAQLLTQLHAQLLTQLHAQLFTQLFTQLSTQLSTRLFTCSDINSAIYLLLKTENSTATYVINNLCFKLYKADTREFEVFIFFLSLYFLLSRTTTIRISI